MTTRTHRALACAAGLFGTACAGAMPSRTAGPPPFELELELGAYLPGQPLDVTARGVPPGVRVRFAGSTVGEGAGPCPRVLRGRCVDLVAPSVWGRGLADGAGEVSGQLTVPGGASQAWVQAVAVDGGVAWLSPVRATSGPLGVADLVAGDLVITEVMKDPIEVTDAHGEWFEVHNPGSQAIDLDGLRVRDHASESFTVSGSLVVEGGGWVVFGADADPVTNGGIDVDYAWSSFFLGDGDDELELAVGSVVVDSILWDDGITWPDPAGASMALDADHTSATDNDVGSAWCIGATPYGDGDLGTPGAPNPSCGVVACPSGTDRDGDGVLSCTDCDDLDPRTWPGAPEVCDGVDNDCDSVIPAGELDGDGDGWPDCDLCDAAGYDAARTATSPAQLTSLLASLTSSQDCDDYTEARNQLFTALFWDGGQVEGAYTGLTVPVGTSPPDHTVMNTEHTWPQSQGTDVNPARCDLHHLFPVDAGVNSRRSNHPFGEVVGAVSWTGGGSTLGEDAGGQLVFEPRDVHKGNVARALLYVHVRHGLPIDPAYVDLLRTWDLLDPVDADERRRSGVISAWQGVDNPFVVCEELAQGM